LSAAAIWSTARSMARRSKKSFAGTPRAAAMMRSRRKLASAAKKVVAVSPMARLVRELQRDDAIAQVLPELAAPGLHVLQQGIVKPGGDLTDARAEARDHRIQTGAEIDITHAPDHAGVQEILNRGVEP